LLYGKFQRINALKKACYMATLEYCARITQTHFEAADKDSSAELEDG
jgi:hypothetical protein